MRKILLILLITLFSAITYGQENKCSKYKNGTFKLFDKANNITHILKRNGNKQYEEVPGEKIRFEFDVNWINDCTYTLHPNKETSEVLNADFTLIVEIIEIKEHSLVLRMYAKESPNDILTEEVEIINTL